MCKYCELNGDVKHYIELHSQWTALNSMSVSIKNLNAVSARIINLTSDESEEEIEPVRFCFHCGAKLKEIAK